MHRSEENFENDLVKFERARGYSLRLQRRNMLVICRVLSELD
jgi:hypothetical protein